MKTCPIGCPRNPDYCADCEADPLEIRGEKEHELKTWPEFFAAVASGEKPFEVRRNDRDFRLGDSLILREWSEASGFTGRELRVKVSYVLSDPAFGTQPGFAVLGLSPHPLVKAAEFMAARIAGLEEEVQAYTRNLAASAQRLALLREDYESKGRTP